MNWLCRQYGLLAIIAIGNLGMTAIISQGMALRIMACLGWFVVFCGYMAKRQENRY